MTTTIECPWCDGPVALHDEDDVLACDDCGVAAHLAPDRSSSWPSPPDAVSARRMRRAGATHGPDTSRTRG